MPLFKMVVIIIDRQNVISTRKLYFFRVDRQSIHNYTSSSNISPYSWLNSSFLPGVFGPNFSRNCTFGIDYLYLSNNGLPARFLFNLSTAAGVTNVE